MTNSGNEIRGASEKNQIGIGYKFLRIFTDVYPGEAPTVLLLTLNGFILFLAYYIIKPLRDALMLDSWPAEIKSYFSAAIAVSLIFVVKAFSFIASRFPRQKLITWVTLFFMSNLAIFYVLHLSGVGPGASSRLKSFMLAPSPAVCFQRRPSIPRRVSWLN